MCTSRIGKYFNNFLYVYMRLNERDTNNVYAFQMAFISFCPFQKWNLISKLQFHAIFHSYSTYFSRIFKNVSAPPVTNLHITQYYRLQFPTFRNTELTKMNTNYNILAALEILFNI